MAHRSQDALQSYLTTGGGFSLPRQNWLERLDLDEIISPLPANWVTGIAKHAKKGAVDTTPRNPDAFSTTLSQV
jgi:hypothetical protein